MHSLTVCQKGGNHVQMSNRGHLERFRMPKTASRIEAAPAFDRRKTMDPLTRKAVPNSWDCFYAIA